MSTQTSSDTVRVLIGNWDQQNLDEKGEFTVTADNIRIHPSYGSVIAKGRRQIAYDFAILEIPDLSIVS